MISIIQTSSFLFPLVPAVRLPALARPSTADTRHFQGRHFLIFSFISFFGLLLLLLLLPPLLLLKHFLFFALIPSPPVGERVDAVFLDQNSKWNVTCPFLVALCR
jgi:hypothetical protein